MNSTLIEAVKDKYASVATSGLSNTHEGVRAVAEAFGYSADELASIPADANMGLSCGNPIALASIREGETVVDLGSGGGLDVFLASKQVGETGKAIGIDMTPAMVERAKRAAAQDGYRNVAFHLSTIDKIPLEDASVDCVISNCVINLAPDKPAVFAEVYRVLKPGGRLAASDIALKRELPDALRSSINAYVGCIAGAELIETYVAQLRGAGFSQIVVQDSGSDLNAYAKVENQSGCCSPAMTTTSRTLPLAQSGGCCGGSKKIDTGSDLHAELADLLKQYNVNDYAASVKVFAIK
jgi:SAM-dependent methyltransferase